MTVIVLVAAGSGQRLGAAVPKALVEVGGRTLLEHCLETIADVPRISGTVVVAPVAEVDAVAAAVHGPQVTVVPGGRTRDASVRAGLTAVPVDTLDVLVHDAARPFVQAAVFDRVLDALGHAEAVIPAVPVADTIKQVHGGLVVATPSRDELVAVQTPQGFRLSVLLAAHDRRSGEVTDDAMLVEQAGVPVHVVPGCAEGFKITTPLDLVVARALLGGA